MNITTNFLNRVLRITCSSQVFLTLLAGMCISKAADPAHGTVIERGPHHRVIKLQVPEEVPGMPPHSYIELCTGMHYWEDGQWKESSEEIEEYALGFVARKGQHKLVLSKNLKEKGSVDLLTPGEQRLRSTPMGLAYYEVPTGKSVLIAELKESKGEKYAPNQVIYRDAFTDIQADVRYIYTRAGFEQDVILRQQLPSPTEFGMNPSNTRLEVWTEFFETAKPETNPYAKKDKTVIDGREVKIPDLMIKQSEQQKVKEDKSVENRYLGGMLLDTGKAFMEEGDELGRHIQKQWDQISLTT